MIDLSKDLVFAEVPDCYARDAKFSRDLQNFLFDHGFSWMTAGRTLRETTGVTFLIMNTRVRGDVGRMVFSFFLTDDRTSPATQSLRDRCTELSYAHLENLISEMPRD